MATGSWNKSVRHSENNQIKVAFLNVIHFLNLSKHKHQKAHLNLQKNTKGKEKFFSWGKSCWSPFLKPEMA